MFAKMGVRGMLVKLLRQIKCDIASWIAQCLDEGSSSPLRLQESRRCRRSMARRKMSGMSDQP